jgi:REP element-mobilizing transposase RayT
LRLAGYDYSTLGAYFVTIGTQHRRCILSRIEMHRVCLTPLGEIVESELCRTGETRAGVRIDSFVIMANHVHAIVILDHVGRRPPRLGVVINAFKSAATRRLRFRLACSKGTYVRVLAEDIGAALGSAAHLEELRRTGFGSFAVDDAVTLDAWDPAQSAGLVALRRALSHLPAVSIDDQAAVAVRQGKSWPLRALPVELATPAMLLDCAGDLIAVAVRKSDLWSYGRVLGTA